MRRETGCVFCDIVHAEADAHVIHQDELVTAFMDINPVNRGHVLVVPNEHAASIQDVDDRVCGHMFVIGRDLDTALRRSALRSEAVNLYLADGRAAGQAVFHTHLHIIPRYPGDSSGLHLHAQAPLSPTFSELAGDAKTLGDEFIKLHGR